MFNSQIDSADMVCVFPKLLTLSIYNIQRFRLDLTALKFYFIYVKLESENNKVEYGIYVTILLVLFFLEFYQITVILFQRKVSFLILIASKIISRER